MTSTSDMKTLIRISDTQSFRLNVWCVFWLPRVLLILLLSVVSGSVCSLIRDLCLLLDETEPFLILSWINSKSHLPPPLSRKERQLPYILGVIGCSRGSFLLRCTEVTGPLNTLQTGSRPRVNDTQLTYYLGYLLFSSLFLLTYFGVRSGTRGLLSLFYFLSDLT